MFILLCVFCVATLSVGILLQIKPRTVLFAIGVGQLLGGVTFLLGENMLPFWTYFAVGLLGAVGYMMLWEKRTFFDGIVAACIGGSHFGLYVTFADSIKGMTGDGVVDLLFVLFEHHSGLKRVELKSLQILLNLLGVEQLPLLFLYQYF